MTSVASRASEAEKPTTMKGGAMSEAPREQSQEAVKQEILEEHGDAAERMPATPQTEDEVIAEEFENDPARNPDNEALKNIKGG